LHEHIGLSRAVLLDLFEAREMEVVSVVLAGLVGGFARALIAGEGVVILPKRVNGKLDLGIFTACLLGAIVGVIVDGSWVTSLMAGLSFPTIIEDLCEKWEKSK